ncbi:MAG: VTT domain-containing protein [Sphingomonas sp.]|uniref:VTT domain-containing protein n=1 Tax=Sphingomonas sp. TaxID=28214 RepID=UPI003565A155
MVVLLLLTLIPFFLFEDDIGRWSSTMLTGTRSSSWASAAMIVLLLASDILLPVPSSLVGAYAGGMLGVVYGAAVNWVGLSLGSAIGYALGRGAGRPALVRLVGADAVDRARALFARIGPAALLVSRGIPVVAEAGLIAAGSASMPLASFIGSVALGNAVVAIAYAVAGSAASTGNYALLVAVLVLVPATSWLVWRALKRPAIAN